MANLEVALLRMQEAMTAKLESLEALLTGQNKKILALSEELEEIKKTPSPTISPRESKDQLPMKDLKDSSNLLT